MQQTQELIFELGESNIFEEFYELIEKHRLNTSNKFEIEDFYKNLSDFDLAYQEFSTSNNEKSNAIVYSYISHCLYCFLVLFKFNGFSDRPFYWAFNRFIQFSTVLLKNSNNIKNDSFYFRNITQNFPSLWRGPYLDLLRKKKINFNLINVEQYERNFTLFARTEAEISVDLGTERLNYFSFRHAPKEEQAEYKSKFYAYCSEYEVLELIWQNEAEIFLEENVSYEMEIQFKISDYSKNAATLVQSLYLIINALSNIDNVKVELEELRTGSLIGRIRLYIKDLLAKEEAKAVLETAKEAVSKTLTGGQVSHAETKKTNAETKKVAKETELIEKDLKGRPTDIEAKLINALNLEKLALENEQLKIQNAKEKLEIVDKLSDLAKKGILGVDEIRIDINGILYLLKSPSELQLPDTNIDDIT